MRPVLRPLAAVLLLLALAGPVSAGAEDGAAPAEPSGATHVLGDLPMDLRGLWLFLVHEYLPHTQQATAWTRNLVEFWLVKGRGEGTAIRLLATDMPPEVRELVAAANAAREPWVPTADDLARLRRAAAHAKGTTPASVQDFTIVAPPHYAARFSGPDLQMTATSPFALHVRRRPGAEFEQDETTYAVRRAEGRDLIGEQLRALTVERAPTPLYMRGAFRLFRLRGPGDGAAAPAP
jgi:hypothetical protein